MLDQEIVRKLRDRYSKVHPLMFHRSVERSKSAGELFDILDTIPSGFPIVWDEATCRWVLTDDLLQSQDFSLGESRREK